MIYRRLYPSLHNSPWPPLLGARILRFISSIIIMLKTGIFSLTARSRIVIRFGVYYWVKNMLHETEGGEYTLQTLDNIKYRFSLLVLREAILFISLFWAFFHYSLSPSIFGGNLWPPLGVEPIRAGGLPLLNTALLVSRGVSITWSHHQICRGNKTRRNQALYLTILLGTIFLINQGIEFAEATFSISDRILGSILFTLTGFHGFHVFVGLFLLVIRRIRLQKNHFTCVRHAGYEASIWYWHFVDCIWLVVYSLIYWWGC